MIVITAGDHAQCAPAVAEDNLRDVQDMGVDAMLIRRFDPGADVVAVPDPYYGGPEDFDAVVAMVQATVPGVRAYVQQL